MNRRVRWAAVFLGILGRSGLNATMVELGASGREAVLVRDPAASKGLAAAVRIGTAGEGFGARWPLGLERVGSGLFETRTFLRVQLPEAFPQNRLRIMLMWLADDQPVAARAFYGSTVDGRKGKYTPLESSFVLDRTASLALICRWAIESFPPG